MHEARRRAREGHLSGSGRARRDAQRPEPPVAAHEAATLTGFVDFLRETVALTTDGLDTAQLLTVHAPSTMTLGGMLEHLADVEDHGVGHVLLSRPPAPPWDAAPWADDPDRDWHSAADETAEQLRALRRATCARPSTAAPGSEARRGVRRYGAAVTGDHDLRSDPRPDPRPDPRTHLWIPEALERYRDRAQELARVLTEHAQGAGQRVGDAHEAAEHAASSGRLRDAVRAFAEAELDWCGADPLATGDPSDADAAADAAGSADDDEVWPAPDPSLAGEPVVSVLGRWDYVVTDADALLEHGRSALLARPAAAGEDAARRVLTVSDAVRETLDDPVLAALEEAPGLQLTTYVHQVLQHGGSPDEVLETDPFGLTRATGDLCSCGHERDPQDRHVRFSLPDALFTALSEGGEVPDLWMSHDDADSSLMVAAPGVGSFVRVLLTVALDDSSTVTYGTWLQLAHSELLRAHEVWFAPQYEHLVLEGELANDLPPGGLLGVHARAVVTDPDLLPRVQDSNDGVLSRVLTEVWGAHLHPDAPS